MTLVDTNVLVTADPQWADWSIASLETASLRGPLLINDVVYAELSVRYERIELLDEFIGRAAGTRGGVLPDFFIGAHAPLARLPLLTRDEGRYRIYFPTVELI